jgi:hypothetical protein
MKTYLSRNIFSLTTLGKTVLITAAVMASTVGWALDHQDPAFERELQRFWTTVGSAGTVDESDRDDIKFHLNAASLSPTAPKFASGKIRYNVTAVDNLTIGRTPTMRFTYIDDGASARVSARLIEVDLKNGAGKTILKFDSNDFPESNKRQQQKVRVDCDANLPLEFDRFAYYIEATLVQDNRTSDKASLEAIQLEANVCIE